MACRWSLWRRSRVNRPRAGLRRNHSALRNNRLARCGLGRSCRSWRTGSSLWRRSGSFWLCRRRYDGRCRWMCRRCNNHRGRRSWFFRRGWWRNHGRGLPRRRRNHSPFRLRCRRFGRNNCRRRLLRCWGQRSGRRCRFLRNRRCRLRRDCGCRGRRTRWWRRRLLLLLLSFPEQLGNIARLGDLGEINLRLHFRGSRSLSGTRAGFRRKVLPHPFRFILLKRA